MNTENDLDIEIGTETEIEEINTESKKKEKINRTKPSEPVLKVAADTPPKRLMKTIMGCLKDWGSCRILAVGERPTWQAYKACVLAKEELASIGISILIDPSFMSPRPVIDGEEKTGADISVLMTKASS